jgi:hypothetical protein
MPLLRSVLLRWLRRSARRPDVLRTRLNQLFAYGNRQALKGHHPLPGLLQRVLYYTRRRCPSGILSSYPVLSPLQYRATCVFIPVAPTLAGACTARPAATVVTGQRSHIGFSCPRGTCGRLELMW